MLPRPGNNPAALLVLAAFGSTLILNPARASEPGPEPVGVKPAVSLVLLETSMADAEAAAADFDRFEKRAVTLLGEPKDIFTREELERLKAERQSSYQTCLSTGVFAETLGAGRVRELRLAAALCTAVAERDPRACSAPDSSAPDIPGAGFSEEACRRGYRDARLAWGLLTDSPEFAKICESDLLSQVMDPGRRAKACRALSKKGDAQAACDRLKRILRKEPAAPASDEPPGFGPENCVAIVNAWKAEPSACESLTRPGQEGLRAGCATFQAFRRAFQARDPKLCAEDSVCGAMMGADPGSCDFLSRVNEPGCKRLLERREVDERDREKRLLADPTNPEGDMARSFEILFPDIQTTLRETEGGPPGGSGDEAVARLKEIASSRARAPNREGLVLAIAAVRVSTLRRVLSGVEAGLDAYRPQFETQAVRRRVGAVRKKVEALEKELVTRATVDHR